VDAQIACVFVPYITAVPISNLPAGRGLHSSTFRLNVSTLSGIGGAFRRFFRGCVVGVRGYDGVSRVYFVPEAAQVELKSGRV